MIAGGGRPLASVAVGIWTAALVALAAGIVLVFRAKRAADGRRVLTVPVGVLTAAVLLGAGGLIAFSARSGDVAAPGEFQPPPVPSLTDSLTPVPVAPDAPQPAEPRPSPTASAEPASIEIGFESIGDLAIGASADEIKAVFGEGYTTRETKTDEGNAVTAYEYRGGGRDFTVYVASGKVRSYSVMTNVFVTFSGVSVGDPLSKAKETYGSKLRNKGQGRYALDGPGATEVVFVIEDSNVARIDGGLLD